VQTVASLGRRVWERLLRVPWLTRPLALLERRREQVLYLVIGGWNTLFGYLIWALLQYLLGDYLNYLIVIVIAWFPSVANAYFGYRWFVFRSKGPILRELARFSLVYVGTLIMGLVALPILLHVLPFTIYVTQALYTAVMVVASYLSHKYFSFGRRPKTLATPAEERAAMQAPLPTNNEGV
jgi:putative flippase GtrA